MFSLPNFVVSVNNINTFKCRLENLWQNEDIV